MAKKIKKSLTVDDIYHVHQALWGEEEMKSRLKAANMVVDLMGGVGSTQDEDMALSILEKFLSTLLDSEQYLLASTLLFTREKFDPRPKCVRRLFEGIPKYSKIAIPGASSMSKTYSIAVWLLLDYVRDPQFTRIRLASVNAEHLRTNLFAHITDMSMTSSIPLALKTSDLFIGTDSSKQDFCIKGVIFPQDNSRSGGRLKGMKPGNRNKAHPKFGPLGRLRLLIDEAQNIPSNVFADFPSIEASINNYGSVKIMVSGNPESYAVSRDFGQICEPQEGFDSLDVDTDLEWEGKTGYNVIRLDANECENVQRKTMVYNGLQTYEGYLGIQRKGVNHYMTFCRGMFPTKGGGNTLITSSMLQTNIGLAVFPHGFVNVGSVDIALKEDKVVLTVGRFGMASGLRKPDGEHELFNRSGKVRPRRMLQIDQQFPIEGINDDIALAKEIQRICKQMNISADWLAMDSTVGGSGVYSWLTNYWGNVLGIEWGTSPTELKILNEDEKNAKERFHRIPDEMWHATAEWLRYGAIRISPSVDSEPLYEQLTNRRIGKHAPGGKQKVEPKPEYKARSHGVSPDFADSFVMMQQICRMRGDGLPGMSMDEEAEAIVDESKFPSSSYKIDSIHYDAKEKKKEGLPWEKATWT